MDKFLYVLHRYRNTYAILAGTEVIDIVPAYLHHNDYVHTIWNYQIEIHIRWKNSKLSNSAKWVLQNRNWSAFIGNTDIFSIYNWNCEDLISFVLLLSLTLRHGSAESGFVHIRRSLSSLNPSKHYFSFIQTTQRSRWTFGQFQIILIIILTVYKHISENVL